MVHWKLLLLQSCSKLSYSLSYASLLSVVISKMTSEIEHPKHCIKVKKLKYVKVCGLFTNDVWGIFQEKVAHIVSEGVVNAKVAADSASEILHENVDVLKDKAGKHRKKVS